MVNSERASNPRPRLAAPRFGEQNSASQPILALIAAIFGLALVRALVAANTGLTDDEAYYRLWALAPAMSYLDHPPMAGWMIAAGRWVAGDNPLGIRLVAVLASLIGPFVLWRTVVILFGPKTALRATWIALAMPLLAVGGVIITPDTPSVLFWGLTAWTLAELHVSRNANWWLAVGVFAGLGLLSKYSNLFVGAGIVLWVLLVPANRFWLRSWQLWAGGIVVALFALPVVLWNLEHEWASFVKQFGRVGHGQTLALSYVIELTGGFVGLMSPAIAVLAILGLWRVSRSAFAGKEASSALIAAGTLPFLLYLLVHSLHDRVQPNWLAPLYPSLAVCAAIALAHFERHRWRAVPFRTLERCTLAIGFLLSGFVYLHAINPIPTGPLKDPTSQMRGWPDFAAEVERVRTSAGACWIATSSYATTGQLAYALDSKTPVVQLTERLRYVHLPPVVGAILACPALYVELERRAGAALLEERFRSVVALQRLVRRHGSSELAIYSIYLAKEPRQPQHAGKFESEDVRLH